jgi:bifunctional DNase/RNase
MLVPMQLSRVIVSDLNDQRAIYLKETDGTRVFPILIGDFEASVINRRLLEEQSYRPMTHDLLHSCIRTLGGTIQEVVVTRIEDHTYYAILRVAQGDEVHEIDCRPSDAVALAIHTDPAIPILVDDSVLEQVS